MDAALLAIACVGLAAPILSTVFGLYDHIQHWGKLIHGLDGFCATALFGLLLLGWRDNIGVDLTDELAGLLTIFGGVFFGMLWEIVEFIRDWVAYSDLQKSNTDTMTDFLSNHVAAIVAALLVVRTYRPSLNLLERRVLGQRAEWLVDGPSSVLDQHGIAVGLLAVLVIVAAVAALWFSDRPIPGIPIP